MVRKEDVLFSALMFCFVLSGVVSQECSPEKEKRCRLNVADELDKRRTGLSTHDLELHCKTLRHNVDCLVYQMTQCSNVEGKDRNGDVIYRGWKYMQTVCDTFGGWWQNRCFQQEESKQCEKHYVGSTSALHRGTCTEYERFRDCVSNVVRKRCKPEDNDDLGSFLLDKAGEMIWKCPGSSVSRSGQLAYGESSVYSSALAAEYPFGSPGVNYKFSDQGCNARSREEIRGCLDRLQFEKDVSLGTREADERLRKSCCAQWNYKRCVQNAFRTHCFDSPEVEATAPVDIARADRDFRCREHWIYTCSGAETISKKAIMQVILLTLCTMYFRKVFY